jgi:hypothetical protein
MKQSALSQEASSCVTTRDVSLPSGQFFSN